MTIILARGVRGDVLLAEFNNERAVYFKLRITNEK